MLRFFPRVFLTLTLVAAAGQIATAAERPRFATTFFPLTAILEEVVHGRAELVTILPPGASAHNFEPTPSDLAVAQKAQALFFASESLDGWAVRIPGPKRIEIFPLVPVAARRPNLEAGDEDHDHAASGGVSGDPHFWTDPLLVRDILPALVSQLAALDPGGAPIYRKNAEDFARRLTQLNARLAQELAPLKGRPVLLYHASFQYFLTRYGLKLAGVVELSPGKEPTPRQLKGLIDLARREKTKVVFWEPQLPKRPAEVLAESAGLQTATLDPIGGVPGRMTYEELLLWNGVALRTARP